MERVSLGSGELSIAPIITGCWQLAGGHGRDVYNDVQAKLEAYADAGFDTFDTADIYGPSERILGEFVASRAAAGKPPVKVLTKYVPNIFNARVRPEDVEVALRKSCAALQVPRLDMVQLHWWDYQVPGLVDISRALADCKRKGLLTSVATTNMDCAALTSILDAGVPVVANQVQFSLLDRRPLNGMVQLCQQHGIKLLTYGSVGGGLLSDKFYEPAPKANLFGQVKYAPVDLSTSSLKMYWAVLNQFGGQELWRELLGVLRGVADKHGCSIANVSTRWVMQQGDGKTCYPIVGMFRSSSHIQDNARALSVQLDASDMAAIQAVLNRSRGPAGDIYSFERGS